MASAKKAIDFVLGNEGGYTVDVGGPTNFGITAQFLTDHGMMQYDLKGDGKIDAIDMRDVTKDDAIAIYTRLFNDYHYDLLRSDLIASRVFDVCVNSGQSRAARMLQGAYNAYAGKVELEEDGVMGSLTIAAVNGVEDEIKLLNIFRMARKNFYNCLIQSNPGKYGKYANGWRLRAAL